MLTVPLFRIQNWLVDRFLDASVSTTNYSTTATIGRNFFGRPGHLDDQHLDDRRLDNQDVSTTDFSMTSTIGRPTFGRLTRFNDGLFNDRPISMTDYWTTDEPAATPQTTVWPIIVQRQAHRVAVFSSWPRSPIIVQRQVRPIG